MPASRPRPELVPTDPSTLSARYREVLTDIIRMHITSGAPVSSRAVSKQARNALSAASIRNVMADLEEAGLLEQPHTSAGRLPTQAAYRLYVEGLMEVDPITDHEKHYIDGELGHGSADQLMGAATHLLSELSHQVGVVLTPAVAEVVLKSADFVSLDGSRVLCVLVSTGGFVDHIVVETEDHLSREELVRISNYVTESFAGLRLTEIRDRLLELMDVERAQVDRWLAQAITLAGQAIASPGPRDVLLEGTTTLLGQPELSDVERVRRVLDTFADKARLVQLLNQCLSARGVRVVLGEDSDVTQELDFSLVATSYGIGERVLGGLGIIGPARMEYPRMVPLVRYLGETLSKALASATQR